MPLRTLRDERLAALRQLLKAVAHGGDDCDMREAHRQVRDVFDEESIEAIESVAAEHPRESLAIARSERLAAELFDELERAEAAWAAQVGTAS